MGSKGKLYHSADILLFCSCYLKRSKLVENGALFEGLHSEGPAHSFAFLLGLKEFENNLRAMDRSSHARYRSMCAVTLFDFTRAGVKGTVFPLMHFPTSLTRSWPF